MPAAPARSPLAALLRRRRVCIALAALGAVFFAAARAGLILWHCPLLAATGWPCPGCGLTRATAELATGHVGAALARHAFAPIALLLGALVLLAAVLPAAPRERLAHAVERCDPRGWTSLALLVALCAYWIARGLA
ncbi:MAG: DUF2752 domain-containing protein [Planctomycetota bacterium]|nr:MAG: DUF2752 domain-containing protein [Planctomycetota bacterium]